MNHQALSSFIWSVADLLRGDYKQSEYGRVILPFTVLRRLDCVLEGTKAAVLAEHAEKQKLGLNPEPFLLRKAGQSFYNVSPLDMRKLMGDQDHIRENLFAWFCQGSRHRLWPTRARLGIGPPLTKGADEDAVLGMRVASRDGAARAHGPGLSPVPLPRVRQAVQ